MAASRGGVERVLKKLRVSVEEGNFYEAHQMYRTLYFRYMSQKKHAEAIELLYSGASLLLKHNQHGSGADLCMLLIEALNNANSTVNKDIIDKICSLLRLLDQESPERAQYINAALKWSAKNESAYKSGHPDLHQQIAMTLWKEKNYCESRYHFIHSYDGKACASMLVEYATAKGYPSEVDMFVTQAVLQLLCLKNEKTASVVFYTYTEKHPDIETGPPFMKPLLNFVWFLLLAIQGGKLTVFAVLCEKYQPSISRDPSYKDYIDRIGQIFFGVATAKRRQCSSRWSLREFVAKSLC
ncbi:Golgi to ER traffic protein 4 homolog [Ptychodera flava]|uniref:Golgi to ER traffic protein 4 homolog n=1 Tax=Ptychodera flava TaxID=63121 RepID=UPI00396A1715